MPFHIRVDNTAADYFAGMKHEVKGDRGLQWTALKMATAAATPPFPREENFGTLTVLADAQLAN